MEYSISQRPIHLLQTEINFNKNVYRCFNGEQMKEIEIQKIIDMNYRSLMLLGYAMSFLHEYGQSLDGRKQAQYNWLMNALENVIYFDKPLPESP